MNTLRTSHEVSNGQPSVFNSTLINVETPSPSHSIATPFGAFDDNNVGIFDDDDDGTFDDNEVGAFDDDDDGIFDDDDDGAFDK